MTRFTTARLTLAAAPGGTPRGGRPLRRCGAPGRDWTARCTLAPSHTGPCSPTVWEPDFGDLDDRCTACGRLEASSPPHGLCTFCTRVRRPAPVPRFPDNATAAAYWAARGLYVFPCQGGTKSPFGIQAVEHLMGPAPDRWPGHDPAKGGFHQACRDEATVAAWWRCWPRALPGLAVPPGRVVVDFDDDVVDCVPVRGSARARLRQARPDLADEFDRLFQAGACHIRTPGGEHIWLRVPGGAGDIAQTNASNCAAAPAGELRRYVDVKGGGKGYGFAPGARNPPAGPDKEPRDYQLVNGSLETLIALSPRLEAALRMWTVHRTAPPPRPSAGRRLRATARGGGRPEPEFGIYRARWGSRHGALCAYAGALARRGLDRQTVLSRIRDQNAALPDPIPPPRAERELRAMADSAVTRYGGARC